LEEVSSDSELDLSQLHPFARGDGMRNGARLWKGALAGAVAGLAASWTMNQFQTGLSKIQKQSGRDDSQGEGEPATAKAANLAAETVLRRELSEQEKKKAAPYIHYGFGAAMGALYGVLAEEFPASTAGFGTAYATGLFLIADEGAVPALRLGKRPEEYPLSTHAQALASHLVYGLSAESVRRGVRAALGSERRDLWEDRARNARDAVVQWQREARTEFPKKVSKLQRDLPKRLSKLEKAARRKWKQVA
jgi:putative membrane protein